jgi:hypothetical protein
MKAVVKFSPTARKALKIAVVYENARKRVILPFTVMAAATVFVLVIGTVLITSAGTRQFCAEIPQQTIVAS